MFKDASYPLFKRWLKPGYGHVTLLKLEKGTSVYIDPGMNELLFQSVGFVTELELKVYGWKVVEVEMHQPKPRISACFITCVSITKYILGLRKCWSITPWQLYRFLRDLKPENYDKHNIVSVRVIEWVE